MSEPEDGLLKRAIAQTGVESHIAGELDKLRVKYPRFDELCTAHDRWVVALATARQKAKRAAVRLRYRRWARAHRN